MIHIIIAAIVLAMDFYTKMTAESYLMPVGTFAIIKDIIHLTYVENRGIAFGMFSGRREIFIVVSVIVLIILAIMFSKTKRSNRSNWLKCGTALVFAGAIGNLAERIYKGYVVDFIDFRIINFPVFNVADIAVCVGATMLVIHFLIAEDKMSKEVCQEAGEEKSE